MYEYVCCVFVLLPVFRYHNNKNAAHLKIEHKIRTSFSEEEEVGEYVTLCDTESSPNGPELEKKRERKKKSSGNPPIVTVLVTVL